MTPSFVSCFGGPRRGPHILESAWSSSSLRRSKSTSVDSSSYVVAVKADCRDAAFRLLELEDGAVSIVGHGMSQENVDRVLSHPLVMIGSDGGSIAPEGPAGQTRPHPRHYGTCARVLGRFVRERGLMDLATAVRKMTSMPADQVGLVDRGRIARGKKADLVLWDIDQPGQLAYPLGFNPVAAIYRRGEWVRALT